MQDVMSVFDALGGETREAFASDLERHYSREELAHELWRAENLAEGFCVAAEGIGPVALMVLADSRERIRQARALADEAARA